MTRWFITGAWILLLLTLAAGSSACRQTNDSDPDSPGTPTPAATSIHTPVPTATQVPTSTPTPELIPTKTPVPTATLTPIPTFTPTPTSTPTAKEVAASHLSGVIPWFASPPDATHVKAVDVITRIWLHDTETGDATAQLTWVVDGMLPVELSPLGAILLISGNYGELGKRVVETTWVADGVNGDEMGVLTGVESYVLRGDSESANLLLASPWVADGITREERVTAEKIEHISFYYREFGRRLISSSLVAGGLNNDELRAVSGALYFIAARDLESATLLLTSSWVADGITADERHSLEAGNRREAAGRVSWVGWNSIDHIWIDSDIVIQLRRIKALDGPLLYIAGRDIELAKLLVASSWVADGITADERHSLEAIDRVSGNSRDLAKLLVASSWVADGITADERHSLEAIDRVC